MRERELMTEQEPGTTGDSVAPAGTAGTDAHLAVPSDAPAATHPAEPVHFTVPPVIGSSAPQAIDTLEDTPPVSGAGLLPAGTPRSKVRLGDRIFALVTSTSGVIVITLVLLIAAYLVKQAIPALSGNHSSFLFSRDWSVNGPVLHFGVAGLLWTTVVVSLIGMVLAVPVAIGIALFITMYAPKQLARPVAYVIDLLAAIPSIVYGIWGIQVLAPALQPVQKALYGFSGVPIFKDAKVLAGSIFDAGVVLAVMILPIITAISRDVFERTPRQHIEAAWALGATRWEMVRLAVLPYGRPGVVSGSMLGLGRALGETVAMYLILSAPGPGAPFNWSIFAGGETFASKIANNAAEFESPKSTGAYIAAGLVLFILTFLVNAIARAIVNRRKEFTE